MTAPLLRGGPSGRRIHTARTVTWIIAVLVVVVLARALVRTGRLSGYEQAWVGLALGVFYAIHVASDIRRGRTATERYSSDPLDDAVRSAPHPSFFWFVIALKGTLAALLIGAALGDLIGVWKL